MDRKYFDCKRPSLEKQNSMSALKISKVMNEESDEVVEENGVFFWVNKSGFPLDERTWDRMWNHIARIHPEGNAVISKIKYQQNLPQITIPQAPLNFPLSASIQDRLERIQKYMIELEYNHTGTQFYEIRKNRPISGLMECAKEMIREALPIKCLEAVILGIYLTNGMVGLERYPISFRSSFYGNSHRHVVLGVYHGGHYGAIGMSRREGLMYKPLIFKSLSDLIFDFERYYIKYWHELIKVKVGMPIPHNQHSYEPIAWKQGVTLNMTRQSHKELYKDLEFHSRSMRLQAKSWIVNLPSTAKGDTTSIRDKNVPPPLRLTRSRSVGKELRSTKSIKDKRFSAEEDYQIRI